MSDYVVTENPEFLKALRAKDESGTGSRALGEYAVGELGIEPPRRLADGSVPDIIMEWGAGADYSQPGTPVWALDMDEADPDDYDPTGAGWESAGWTSPTPAATTDPEIEARLRERADELSSRELADFAHELGLFPPGYSEEVNPPLVLIWPPGADLDSGGWLVWDMRPDED